MKRGGPVASLLTVAFAVAWAWAGFRNLPRLGQPASSAAGLAIAVACWLCYLSGRRAARASAVAAAIATAEAHAASAAVADSTATASSAVNVLVVTDRGAGARATGAAAGLDDMPWIVGPATQSDELATQEDVVQNIADELGFGQEVDQ